MEALQHSVGGSGAAHLFDEGHGLCDLLGWLCSLLVSYRRVQCAGIEHGPSRSRPHNPVAVLLLNRRLLHGTARQTAQGDMRRAASACWRGGRGTRSLLHKETPEKHVSGQPIGWMWLCVRMMVARWSLSEWSGSQHNLSNPPASKHPERLGIAMSNSITSYFAKKPAAAAAAGAAAARAVSGSPSRKRAAAEDSTADTVRGGMAAACDAGLVGGARVVCVRPALGGCCRLPACQRRRRSLP